MVRSNSTPCRYVCVCRYVCSFLARFLLAEILKPEPRQNFADIGTRIPRLGFRILVETTVKSSLDEEPLLFVYLQKLEKYYQKLRHLL